MNRFKILFIIALISITACNEIPDGVVDVKSADYTVNQIIALDNFSSSSTDTLFVTSIKIENSESVSEVWCSVRVFNSSKNLYDKILLSDNGTFGDVQKNDNIFTGAFVMNNRIASGKYIIEYFIKDNIHLEGENVKKVGVHSLNFSNGTNNNPPSISELVMVSTVIRDEEFIITLKASDPEGLDDISEVVFSLYDPTGAPVSNFPLYDNGDLTTNGDATAADGIFSSKRSFKSNVLTGKWKFVFQAKDKGGLVSNTITKELTVN